MKPPALYRALDHLAASGFDAEADSASSSCRAARTHALSWYYNSHLTFAHARSRLEYYVRMGDVQRVGWMMDWGGAQVLQWGERPGHAPRWVLQLFDRPPLEGEWRFEALRAHWPLWPAPAAHAKALELMVSRAGGAPHGGFWASQDISSWAGGFGPRIDGPLAAWRAAHPGALVANVWIRRDLTDADFVHLVGVRALRMSDCANPGLTDAAFAHLRGIHTLRMSRCTQPALTEAAFAHLCGIHTLWLGGCNQAALTDAALAHLRGVQVLDLRGCGAAPFTRRGLALLRGVRVLNMYGCAPAAVEAARSLGLAVAGVVGE